MKMNIKRKLLAASFRDMPFSNERLFYSEEEQPLRHKD
jgi:hypothetical protein